MRFRLICAIVLLAAAIAAGQPSSAATTELTCKAYLLYNCDKDRIEAHYNIESTQPIASLTKLMTAILVTERLRFDGRYVLTKEERDVFKVDTMRAQKMLEMMLIASNNHVCKVASRLVSGSESAFVEEMNNKALQMGLKNTRFANSSGLPGGVQYSTLEDVLALARAAYAYPSIRQAMSSHSVELDGKRYDGTLADLYERHEGLIAGKTGYTRAAGRCLVLRYRSHGQEYFLITFGSKDSKASFRDAEILLKYHGLYNGSIGTWD